MILFILGFLFVMVVALFAALDNFPIDELFSEVDERDFNG